MLCCCFVLWSLCRYLVYRLSQRYRISLSASPAVLRDVLSLLRPTGFLVLRTMAITLTYSVATASVARTGAVHAACHQICFQVVGHLAPPLPAVPDL